MNQHEAVRRSAPTGPRVVAGLVDASAVVLLTVGIMRASLLLGGVVLPVWAALMAVVVYDVAWLWRTGQTLGLRFFALRVVGTDGRLLAPIPLLLREMVGRGYFAAAVLFAMAMGATSGAAGMRFTLPVGLGLGLFLGCLSLLAFAIVGHVMVFLRPDGLGLADLLARSRVEALPSPQAVNAQWLASGVVSVLGLGAALAVPLVLGSRAPAGYSDLVDRVKLEQLERRFAAHPEDAEVAAQLASFLGERGDAHAADVVRRRHRAARDGVVRAQEAALRARLQAAPDDLSTTALLVELLTEQGRVQEAGEAYAQWGLVSGREDALVDVGEWLYQHGLHEAAVDRLKAAVDAGADGPRARALLGLALVEAGRVDEGIQQLKRALARDPSLVSVKRALAELEAQRRPQGTNDANKRVPE